eukprot:bmy_01351T0
MATLGLLLSVLGLVLCGTASLGLSAPPTPTSKKPIIGEEAAGAGGRGPGPRWALPAAALRRLRPVLERPKFRKQWFLGNKSRVKYRKRILMQRCHSENMKILGKYYIAASYVKYLESAGARVVPIRQLSGAHFKRSTCSPLATVPVTPFHIAEAVSFAIITRLFAVFFKKNLLKGSFVSRKSDNMEAPSVFKECDLVCFACKASEALEFVTPAAPNQQLSPLIVINRARKFKDDDYEFLNSTAHLGLEESLEEFSGKAQLRSGHHRLDLKDEEYEKLFKSINGILFPGGSVNLMKSGYAHVAKIFYKLAIQVSFCPLQSRMFQNFPADLLLSLAIEPLTANFHKWSLSVKDVKHNLIVRYQYPVYGVQWHPEKAPYEWGKLKGISHAPNAVRAAFYLAEFFVAEDSPPITLLRARKNNHHFESDVEEGKALIYQYRPVYTGNISSFQQSYIFD